MTRSKPNVETTSANHAELASEPTSEPTPVLPAKKPVEEWAQAKRLEDWQFAATRAHERWPVGFLVTEAEFAAAVKTACGAFLG